MTKDKLRKQFLEKRNNLSLECLQEKSQAISQHFFNRFDLHKTGTLHVFLPIVKHNEINTWVIIQKIFRNYPNVTLVASKSNFQTHRMESYVLQSNTKIIENRWGIPEPVDAIKCPDDTIDMILMPLLCFDKQGFRVGYGKGFYDRFLQTCKKKVIKIGLSLFEPVDKIEDINDYDVRMDFCVMSEWVWNLS
ncbi:MAG TPA: 5-formyltetrahydrofolate cyclo-ligase [Thioploca sp.]|nr:MAG: 5-formyltetrahydrofolate cyclo-ligase [Gammaproteobacteria bacterium]HDN27466.1 5-formyltetrahydrofolate cyclo-ligase [Thioploca sp.]